MWNIYKLYGKLFSVIWNTFSYVSRGFSTTNIHLIFIRILYNHFIILPGILMVPRIIICYNFHSQVQAAEIIMNIIHWFVVITATFSQTLPIFHLLERIYHRYDVLDKKWWIGI